MFGAIQSSGALTIYPFTDAINPEAKVGTMARESSIFQGFKSTTVLKTFFATRNLIVTGDPNDGYGFINFYNPADLKPKHFKVGTSDNQFLGNQVVYR